MEIDEQKKKDKIKANSVPRKREPGWVDHYPSEKFNMFPGMTFEQIFKNAATCFMSKEEIAKMLGVDEMDLNMRCREVFGMDTSECIERLRGIADQDVRATLGALMKIGNTTATQIYTKYISKIANDAQADKSRISVVVNIPKEKDND